MLQAGVRAAGRAGRSFRSSRREDPLPRVAWDEKKSSSKGQQKTPGKTMGKPLKNGDFFNKHAQLSNKNGKGKHENMG